ncbi:MAG: VWA domain-containing protein, partial [Acidimicrobiia bacterium]
AKAAARQFIAAKAPNDWIAVVAFSSQAFVKSDFTQDGAALTAAIDSLAAEGETALWDGVSVGAGLYAQHPELQPNILLLSDGADTVSTSNETGAVASVTSAKAQLFAIGIQSTEFNPALLGSFVQATGGSLATSLKPEDLSAEFTEVRRAIENQYEVTYRSTGNGGSLALDLTVAGASTHTQTRAGTLGVAPEPVVVDASGGLFANAAGKWLIVGLLAGSVGLGAFGLLVIFLRKDQNIDSRLGAYVGADAEDVHNKSLAETGFVQRAVEVTSKVAGRSGMMKVEALLEQANLPLRPAEALFFYAAGVVMLGLLALIGAPSIGVGLMALAVIAIAPIAVVKAKVAKRLKTFEKQLPDT